MRRKLTAPGHYTATLVHGSVIPPATIQEFLLPACYLKAKLLCENYQ
jgi:hypothetical protein